MGFWSKKTGQYWVGVASRYLEAGEPAKVLAAVSHLYKFKQKEDQDSQATYGSAVLLSALAYVALGDLVNARIWLHTFEDFNPPNKKWLEDLRKAVGNLEAERKDDYLAKIENLEASGGEAGVLLAMGFRNIERALNEEAIEAFNGVLKSCGLPDPQMGVKERAEYDQKISIALLGLVLSYSGLAQFDKAKEYLGMLDRINPNMAEEFRETWKRS